MKTKELALLLFKIVCLGSLASTSLALAADFNRLDEAIPMDGYTEQYAPLFDFDGDGCLPSAGISREGEMNPGLRPTGPLSGDCRSFDFLETSNTLHRFACITRDEINYCGHFYALYFEKDQCYSNLVVPDPFCGHIHDWEYVAVWTIDGEITDVCASAHGECHPKPASDVLFNDDHPMIVYHKEGLWTHAMRFANTNDVNNPENPYKRFVTPTLVSWYELTGDDFSNRDMRYLLNAADFGSATIPLKSDSYRFVRNLIRWKPADYPVFSIESIEASNPELSLEALFHHRHEYHRGAGPGHRNRSAETGPPIPVGGQ